MIRGIHQDRLEASGALDLVWRVFQEFEAPDYSREGIEEFKRFIALETVGRRMSENQLFLWGCFDGDRIVGVIAARPPCHIALLFVEKAYHRRGIARSLFDTVIDFYMMNGGCSEITVNSSPYAVEAYRRLGFVDTDTEQSINGLRFVPMKRLLGESKR